MGACEKPGVLILVAGPSGAGKDTLISAARRALAGSWDFVFPSRLITRNDQTGEEHIYVTRKEFERMRREKLFFLDWNAHGFSYGIAAAIGEDLEAGRTVVFNVSRRMIPEARKRWRHTEVVFVHAAPEALRGRLRSRGRETEAEIEARVRRAGDEACSIRGPIHVLDNSGQLDAAIGAFLALLHRLSTGAPPECVPAYDFENASAVRLSQQR